MQKTRLVLLFSIFNLFFIRAYPIAETKVAELVLMLPFLTREMLRSHLMIMILRQLMNGNLNTVQLVLNPDREQL
jgi:ABC-type spermidine/putrescine transport system permease subunit I